MKHEERDHIPVDTTRLHSISWSYAFKMSFIGMWSNFQLIFIQNVGAFCHMSTFLLF